jgi:SOS-response transcriptional repressor LexA
MKDSSTPTMIATVPAADRDNKPIIELGDGLTIQTYKILNHSDIEDGTWVIVRNPGIRRGRYVVRQYWRAKNGAWLVAGNPAMPPRPVTDKDAIDGIVLEVHKAEPARLTAHH